MVGTIGLEPTTSTLSRWRSNQAELRAHLYYYRLKATTGVEPVIKVLQTSALTTWLRRRKAGNGIRTRDPQLGKLMLYQLSYSRRCAHRPGRPAVNYDKTRFHDCKAPALPPCNGFVPCPARSGKPYAWLFRSTRGILRQLHYQTAKDKGYNST